MSGILWIFISTVLILGTRARMTGEEIDMLRRILGENAHEADEVAQKLGKYLGREWEGRAKTTYMKEVLPKEEKTIIFQPDFVSPDPYNSRNVLHQVLDPFKVTMVLYPNEIRRYIRSVLGRILPIGVNVRYLMPRFLPY